MVQAMLAGVASIRAQQTRMNVIGNNLANINTTAFKSGRVTFQDMMSQTLRGAIAPSGPLGGLDPMQVGMGVKVGATDANMTQGSLQATNRPGDMAIQGNGMFVVSDGTQLLYTRDGAFDLDANGDLVQTSTGLRLTGWTANPETGEINTSDAVSSSSTINIPVGLRTALQATTTMEWTGNLSSGAAVGDTSSNKVFVYDSLGAAHSVQLTYTKTGDNEWSWSASSPDGTAAVAGSGTLSFDPATGKVTSGGTSSLTVTPTGGAPASTISLTLGRMTQVSGDSNPAASAQNGFPPGSLSDYTISTDGVITGIYSNGLTRPLAQIALASFPNSEGMERVGSNLYRETNNSGAANIGAANTGGRGAINEGYLEQSNVDIGSEFTDLIVTQRGFQANTKIVTTVDEMLQDLINLKR